MSRYLRQTREKTKSPKIGFWPTLVTSLEYGKPGGKPVGKMGFVTGPRGWLRGGTVLPRTYLPTVTHAFQT